jgi:NTE family protein
MIEPQRKRIAIACQGGGSQCAFIAGALDTLLSLGVQHRFDIVGLSGTSGGALTAAVAWVGLLKQAKGDSTPVERRVLALWEDLTAQSPQELFIDRFTIELLRATERGLVPSVATSPSSPKFRLLSQATATIVGRPEFTDLRALVLKHIDFEALPELVEPESPVLLVGAADILEGSFKTFSSMRGEIEPEAILASAAVPNLFPAVWVRGHAYWDGIFSSNPPVSGFVRRPLMGSHALPQEIWIVQINRSRSESVPELPSDIFDRRNHLAGNLSLQHEIEFIEMLNLLLQEGALTQRFLSRFNLENVEPIRIRFIRMSEKLQAGLDYPSKLSREPSHIQRLVADGQQQAKIFLDDLDAERGQPASEAQRADLH